MKVLLITLAAVVLSFASPKPAAAGKHSEQARIIQIIKHRFGAAAAIAIRVARCESHLNPRAVSRTGDHGLFQINWVAHHNWVDFRRITDPAYNTYIAWRLSRHGTTWSAWRNSEGCWG